jgi:hypothetical protein
MSYALHCSHLLQAHIIAKLAEDLAALCTGSEGDLSRRRSIVLGLMTSLLSMSYSTVDDETGGASTSSSSSKALRKISVALTDSVTKHLLSVQQGDINAMICLHDPSLDLSPDTVKRFCSRQLALILSREPEMKVSEALSSQAAWTYSKLPVFLRDVYMQVGRFLKMLTLFIISSKTKV